MSTHATNVLSVTLLAGALALTSVPARAQHEGHAMPMPAPRAAPKAAAVAKPSVRRLAATPAPARAKAAPVDHAAMGHAPAAKQEAKSPAVDHAAMGHGSHAHPPAKPKPKPAQRARPATAAKAAMDHEAMGHGTRAPRPSGKPEPRAPQTAGAKSDTTSAKPVVDHAAMGHGTPAKAQMVDHAAMGHGAHGAGTVDHAAMGHGAIAPAPVVHDHGAMGRGATSAPDVHHSGVDHSAMEHAAMEHAAMGHGVDKDLPADAAPRTPIPALTDADREAAFPDDAHGHHVHDQRAFSYRLVDRLEWQDNEEGSLGWEGLAWMGGDIDRMWLRTEGEASDGEVESATVEVLYGRAVTPWWDAVAGVRHDFGHGPSRTYAAVGVQGLAPYKFEVEATAFVGTHGRGGVSLEAEYDTLVTNRFILQWQAGTTLYAKDDHELGVASGLSTIEAGMRLRYEFTRRFAPYVGLEFERAFGGTADLRHEHGEATRDTRLVAGIRFWF